MLSKERVMAQQKVMASSRGRMALLDDEALADSLSNATANASTATDTEHGDRKRTESRPFLLRASSKDSSFGGGGGSGGNANKRGSAGSSGVSLALSTRPTGARSSSLPGSGQANLTAIREGEAHHEHELQRSPGPSSPLINRANGNGVAASSSIVDNANASANSAAGSVTITILEPTALSAQANTQQTSSPMASLVAAALAHDTEPATHSEPADADDSVRRTQASTAPSHQPGSDSLPHAVNSQS